MPVLLTTLFAMELRPQTAADKPHKFRGGVALVPQLPNRTISAASALTSRYVMEACAAMMVSANGPSPAVSYRHFWIHFPGVPCPGPFGGATDEDHDRNLDGGRLYFSQHAPEDG